MAQQTAVSWLKDMLEWNYGDPQMLEITWENLDDLLERAKQMEKEQIAKAYMAGLIDGMYRPPREYEQPREYYNDRYGSQD